VTNVGGRLDVKSQSAKVTASDIKQGASIFSTFHAIEARRVGGDFKADGESSSVLAEDIAGGVDINNSFKSVVLRQTSGSIRVRGESSSVEVSRIKNLPDGSVIDIRTTFKPILISFPAAAELKLTARTDFGKILSDFPVYLEDTDEKKQIRLETGKGGVTVTLETSAGITIKKE